MPFGRAAKQLLLLSLALGERVSTALGESESCRADLLLPVNDGCCLGVYYGEKKLEPVSRWDTATPPQN